jgi:hypothetical protein
VIDLVRWQCGELRLVASELYPLLFLAREAMRNMAGTAFTTFQTDPFTTISLTPAFEGSQADTDLSAYAH